MPALPCAAGNTEQLAEIEAKQRDIEEAERQVGGQLPAAPGCTGLCELSPGWLACLPAC